MFCCQYYSKAKQGFPFGPKEKYMMHKRKEKIHMKYTLFFLTSGEMGQPFF